MGAKFSHALAASVAALLLVLTIEPPANASASNETQSADALSSGFANPPDPARPRVWWHWMNGNVTKDGIAKDLEWMKRVGIGGMQNFDANLFTPLVVQERLSYMTPPWKDAFRFAASKAEDLGLELTIAASPGWSETGGPWVEAKDGMKKVVWTEVDVTNGRGAIKVPSPSNVPGPFLDYPADVETLSMLIGKAYQAPSYYADIAVLAYPISAHPELPTPRITAGSQQLESGPLADGSLTTAVEVPRGSADKPAVINVDYESPQTVRSATLFVSKGVAGGLGGPSTVIPQLEAKLENGAWQKIAGFEVSNVPTTISFAPVKASSFRVVFAPNPAAQIPAFVPAAGAEAGILASLSKAPTTMRVAQLRLDADARINRYESKAGFSTASDYYAIDQYVGDDSIGIDPAQIIDLTSKMKTDGTLDWVPPPGHWRVVRLGYSLTGKVNHPATAEATGLEVDKYDSDAVRRYMEHYLAMYKDAAGADLVGARGVRAILTDSTEVGSSNWTPDLLNQFQRLRGYDANPYLLTLAGKLVGSRRQSDAFLYDFRRTLADLMASEHYGTVAKVAHEHGLKVYGEALESGRPTLGDDIDMRKYADYPMAALWTYTRERGPRPSALADMKGASSTANLYGKQIVAAESLTAALTPWAHSPADLRRIIDLEFAHGINRPVIHTSVHQPLDDKKPGLSLAIFGQYFTRHETWAEMAKPWVDYMSRNSFMLQQGRSFADVAYFYGEEAPLTAIESYFPDVPRRYAYDFVNADAVLNVLAVEGGDLVAPSGARYEVLYLGGSSRKMTLAMLRRLESLVAAGATIVGLAPEGSPNLASSSEEYGSLVKRLWSGSEVTTLGKGRVIASSDVERALGTLGIKPDFEVAQHTNGSEILFVHRKLDDGDIYFVSNRKPVNESTTATFRMDGRTPEIWRADTGHIEPVSYRIKDGMTEVDLDLDADESFFVVFRKPAAATSAEVPKVGYEHAVSLNDNWDVAFEAARGAPANLKLATLSSLADHTDTGVKYFSGIAKYTRNFRLPQGIKPGQSLILELGTVGDVAEVRVNGKLVGTVWHPPYRVDIGAALRRGDNQLEIDVANLWVNRLIGDAQPGATKVAFTALPTYRADAPLRASGLIGPVQLKKPVAPAKLP